MLGMLTQQDREQLLSMFKKHALKIYNECITKWIMANWKVIDDQRLQLIKHIMHQSPSEILPVLDLSIAVNFKDIDRFVDVAKGFVTWPAARTVLVCLNTKTVV